MNAYTTIEESKQLIEAGLDVNTHDMFYYRSDRREEYLISVGKHPAITNNLFSYRNEYVIPCWSLAALIDLIPEGTHWYLDENGLTITEVDYYKDGKEVYVFRELYRNPVDAIIWLLEHNYIKSNKND